MDEKETVERLTKVEERSKSNMHRLEKLEPIVDEIHTMSKNNDSACRGIKTH